MLGPGFSLACPALVIQLYWPLGGPFGSRPVYQVTSVDHSLNRLLSGTNWPLPEMSCDYPLTHRHTHTHTHTHRDRRERERERERRERREREERETGERERREKRKRERERGRERRERGERERRGREREGERERELSVPCLPIAMNCGL